MYSKEHIDEELKRIKCFNASKGLQDFTTYTKPDYEVNFHHEIICDEIDDFLNDPNRTRLMILAPPRKGKSELISRRLPAYYLGRNPNKNIISASYGAELSRALNRDVQKVMTSQEFREVFPDVQIPSVGNKKSKNGRNAVRTASQFEIVNYEGGLISTGVGGSLTGRSVGDLILLDDLLKDWKQASSKKVRKAIQDWYNTVARTRLAPDGKIIIINTRWHNDDISGFLLSEAKKDKDADQWEVLSFQEIFEPNYQYNHPRDPREEGEVLWPERYSLDKMLSTKKSIGNMFFTNLYQQNPTIAGGNVLKVDKIKSFKFRDLPKFDYIYASWDFTFDDTESSDYVAGGVFGVKDANKYLIWLEREKLSFTNTIARMVYIKNKFPSLRFTVVENKANGPSVISVLQDKVKGLVKYNPTESKILRAQAISPQVEAGQFFVPDLYDERNRMEMPWINVHLNDFLEEVKDFPNGANDDMVDMMVQAFIYESNGPKWLGELINKEATKDANSEFSELRRIMGWSS